MLSLSNYPDGVFLHSQTAPWNEREVTTEEWLQVHPNPENLLEKVLDYGIENLLVPGWFEDFVLQDISDSLYDVEDIFERQEERNV